MSSTSNVDTYTTNDTLEVTNKDKVSYGGKGDILVDDGGNVIQKTIGTDGYVLTYDTTQPGNITYKPYLSTINLTLPVQGGISSANNATRYSGFNIRIARSFSTLIDFYTVPYDTYISAVELILLPNGTSFAWPSMAITSYFAFRMGYSDGSGNFVQFSPSPNPHFTVAGSSAPIAGVTNFDRSGSFQVVRYVPSTTWNVTAGTKITLQCVTTNIVTNYFIIVMIYLKGDLS